MRIALAAVPAVLFWAGNAAAFPAPSYTLAERMPESELIVVVRTGKTRELKRSDYGFANHATPMTVLKTLRGRAVALGGSPDLPREIIVGTDLGGGCPYDARFTEGRMELLFLKWKRGEDLYRLVFREQGAIPLADDVAVEQYERRIAELTRILALADPGKRSATLTDFYVAMTIHPATRADGLDGLERSAEGPKPHEPRILSADQRRRLADAVVRERPPTILARQMIWLIGEYPHAELDRFLVDCVRHWEDPKWEPVVDAAVGALPKRLKFAVSADLEERLAAYFSDRWWSNIEDFPGEKRLLEERRPILKGEFLKLLETADGGISK
jgi:hypothetical protein